jgi:hypothetical protein
MSNFLSGRESPASGDEGHRVINLVVYDQLKAHRGRNLDRRVMKRQSTPAELEKWEKTLSRLEAFFHNYPLPNGPIWLSQCETVADVNLFVVNGLSTARTNFGVPAFAPYVTRLVLLSRILTQHHQKAA